MTKTATPEVPLMIIEMAIEEHEQLIRQWIEVSEELLKRLAEYWRCL